jgi:hypothetical protein
MLPVIQDHRKKRSPVKILNRLSSYLPYLKKLNSRYDERIAAQLVIYKKKYNH